MTKPYDATTKDLIEADPAGWVTYLGHPVSPSAVRLVDDDLSTVTTGADKVIRVTNPHPWLLHLEIQTVADAQMARRLLRYNAMLQLRHEVPVASAVVLLRSERDMPDLTGQFEVRTPVGAAWEFRYDVVRVWERPVEEFLTGPLGLLPLAPLADIRRPDLPSVVGRMRERIGSKTPGPLEAKLWAASYVLMGLRYQTAMIESVLAGVMQMEESVTYQALIRRGMEKGRAEGIAEAKPEEARHILLRQGRKKFGREATAKQRATLEAITELDRLEALSEKLLDVSTWAELLKPE